MKSEVIFALENATWPALLVNAAGKIVARSEGAKSAFGPSAEPGATLGACWGKENREDAAQFLRGQAAALASPAMLHMRLKDGASGLFEVQICRCQAEDSPLFLLQFRNAAEGKPPETASPAPAPGAESGRPEWGAASRQKLDCALQLTRTVALDFNNALTSILGHTSLILGKMEPGHPWRSSLLEVKKSSEKAAEIAHDLAAFSRQDKEVKALPTRNLNELIQSTVAAFRGSNPVVDWVIELEKKNYTVPLDEAKMRQAFNKILENAMQAIRPPGRVVVRTSNLDVVGSYQDESISLSPGTYVCVEFADNGCGIDPIVLPRIFEPFFSTKNSPNHRGLGLAWVYGIVTNHGGSVAVSSTVGLGTSVRLYLPAHKKFTKESDTVPDDLTGTQTVLMVDDEDLLLTMGEMILSSFGYTVITANSGAKALQIFAERGLEIDLVITDLVMPQMSGRELIESLRAMNPGVKILCATGYMRGDASEEDEGYLQKPFTTQDLLRKVKQALAG